MNTLLFATLNGRTLLSEWWYTLQANVVLFLTTFWLQADFWFWVQVTFLLIGGAWCVAMVGTLLFGGWYLYTHPTTGNDRVMWRIAHLLRFLTFGLTDAPFSDLKSEGTSQDVPPRSLDPHL